MSAVSDYIRAALGDDPELLARFEQYQRNTNSTLATMTSIEPETLAAIQEWERAEAELDGQRREGALSEEAYYAAWSALIGRIPEDVRMAKLKLSRVFADASAASSEDLPPA